MEGRPWYPVCFDCPDMLQCQEKAVERYFRNQRKSGGGEGGPLHKDPAGVYTIAFKSQRDQLEVLRRKNHEVEIKGSTIKFSVHEGEALPSATAHCSHTHQPPDQPKLSGDTPKTCGSSGLPPSGELQELQMDGYLLRFLEDCPKARKWVDKQLVFLHCTAELFPEDERVLVRRWSQQGPGASDSAWKTEIRTLFESLQDHFCCHFETDPSKIKALLQPSRSQNEDDVKVYTEIGLAVVVGETAQVEAKLNALREKVSVKRKCTALALGEGKLRLLRGQLLNRLQRDFPTMIVTLAEGGVLELEGSAEDVFQVEEIIAEQCSLVMERTLSYFSPGFIAFWNKAYGSPGMLSDYMRLGVEIEIEASELHIFSFSTKDLDETEQALLREFKLIEFPYQYLKMFCSIEKKVMPILQNCNRDGRRVDVIISSNMIYLVGHTKEVEELNEEVMKLIMESFGQIQNDDQHRVPMSCSNDCSYTSPRTLPSSETTPPFSSLSLDEEEAEVMASYRLRNEVEVDAARAFGEVGGHSLTKRAMIDDRREVVESLTGQSDRRVSGLAPGDAEGPWGLESPTRTEAEVSQGNVRVELVQGTIENQQVDVVVSPMFEGDPLCTQIGSCLYKTAGQQLASLYSKPDGGAMPGDSVLVEGLVGTAFKAVIFVELLRWDGDPDGTAVEVLRLSVNDILTTCENKGITSVAFPALGCGAFFCFPEEIVEDVLTAEMNEFNQRRTSTTPFLINIVCPPDERTSTKTFSSIQETSKPPVDQESEAKRVILIGKTGSGKSSLGNTVLGEDAFKVDNTPNSGTKLCQSKTKVVNGRKLTLIDTPGLFDSDCPEEELMPKILSCITESTPGPHAFLIVLKVEKFSEQEQAIIDKICEYFTEGALQFATVVFTHGNQLPKGTSIGDFVQKSKRLSELVRKCGNRCHVVDNTYWDGDSSDPYRNNEAQVEALLQTIDEMVKSNVGGFYTNKTFRAMEEDIEKEEELIKKDNHLMSEQELRNEAKKRVTKRWLIRLVGVATGTVLGAVFGVEALVLLVIKAVKHIAVGKGCQKVMATLGTGATVDVALPTVGVAAGVAVGVAALSGGIVGGAIGGCVTDEAESVEDGFNRAMKGVTEARANVLNGINRL